MARTRTTGEPTAIDVATGVQTPEDCDRLIAETQTAIDNRRRKYQDDAQALESAFCTEKDELETRLRKLQRAKSELEAAPPE